MYEKIKGYFEQKKWSKLEAVNDMRYCTLCGIKKKRGVRHCPYVD